MDQLVYHAVATGNLGQVLELVAEKNSWSWTPHDEKVETQRLGDVVDLGKGHGPNETTLLHVCSAKSHVRTAKVLLDMLAGSTDAATRRRIVNRRECSKIGGYTPLHLACLSKCTTAADMAELLIQYGADPDVKDANCSFTALHLAVRSHAFEVARVLVRAGADLLARDKFGNNPAFWLKELYPDATTPIRYVFMSTRGALMSNLHRYKP
ncbi:Ankyrin repeat domain-containing protein 1 [Hondaea fermentalgiana]|uniref:Ankyrin repeat domain-containing protein 1 n=1 Tax=Hondaea fermentalgiana TaxID=2315210 RepID=A0A2R5GUT9_9STRA|nr:Ankyrin repeat domain-containing protein 1 [Hondaea fermentalgiana]|eukprot:GBG34325.1 Ankyrin repeat domain-containing protein 1 [Hondaea fermentalgiana]